MNAALTDQGAQYPVSRQNSRSFY